MEIVTRLALEANQDYSLASIANAYGNVTNSIVQSNAHWIAVIRPDFLGFDHDDERSLVTALKQSGVPYLKRRTGWNKSGRHFHPKFSGVAISILDLPRLLNFVRPAHRVEEALLREEEFAREHCDPIYSNDDH